MVVILLLIMIQYFNPNQHDYIMYFRKQKKKQRKKETNKQTKKQTLCFLHFCCCCCCYCYMSSSLLTDSGCSRWSQELLNDSNEENEGALWKWRGTLRVLVSLFQFSLPTALAYLWPSQIPPTLIYLLPLFVNPSIFCYNTCWFSSLTFAVQVLSLYGTLRRLLRKWQRSKSSTQYKHFCTFL